jgi:hypothetical protein
VGIFVSLARLLDRLPERVSGSQAVPNGKSLEIHS